MQAPARTPRPPRVPLWGELEAAQAMRRRTTAEQLRDDLRAAREAVLVAGLRLLNAALEWLDRRLR